jgi:hypothetical protein
MHNSNQKSKVKSQKNEKFVSRKDAKKTQRRKEKSPFAALRLLCVKATNPILTFEF